MQEGRPVAFKSKKLSDVERRWPTHEKELWAVVHCLKLWQHYLGLEYTKVYTGQTFRCDYIHGRVVAHEEDSRGLSR